MPHKINHYHFTSPLRSRYSYPARRQKQVLQGEPVNRKQTITKQAALPINSTLSVYSCYLAFTEKPRCSLVAVHLSMRGRFTGSHTPASSPCAGTAASSGTAAPDTRVCASAAHLACFSLISVSTQHLRRGRKEQKGLSHF